MNNTYFSRVPGFTLAEMIVVVAILMITMVVAGVGFDRTGREVERAAQELYSHLLYARNLSLSGKVFIDDDSDGDKDVPQEYGVYVDHKLPSPFSFDLYADATSVPGNYYTTQDSQELFLSLLINESDVVVTPRFNGASFGLGDWKAVFAFSIPRGTISYQDDRNGTGSAGDTIEIIFTAASDPSIKKSVVITLGSDQIYVEQNP